VRGRSGNNILDVARVLDTASKDEDFAVQLV
jgi:hypothetical protein